jgi:drug/metabolite transporter (DMT)-like permease
MTSLLLAIILSSLIVAAFKVFDRLGINIPLAITVNYLIASLLGLAISGFSLGFSRLSAGSSALSIFLGISFILVFHLFARSAAKAGVAITAVSSKMSLLIPVLAGFLLFGDQPQLLKLAGIALALVSFVLILWVPRSQVKRSYILLPLLIFLGNGINDTLLKYAQHSFLTGPEQIIPFLTLLFMISLLAGMLSLFFLPDARKPSPLYMSAFAGVVLGLLNWGSTYYFLHGLNSYPVSIFLPSFNAGVVAFSSLMGLVIFRERLSSLNWLGIVIATLAIIFIALP